jgi:hypothetical protein
MQTLGRSVLQSRAGAVGKILLLAVAAVGGLQGCGGHASNLNPNANATLTAIQIAPATSLIPLAGNLQLTAKGTYSDGTTLDVTSQVTWSASSAPSTTDFVTVNSSGVASAKALGTSVITATLGSVVGLLQLTVNTDGYSSGTFAILAVPFKSSIIDAAYLPQSQSKIQGAYSVQEVNLDADQFSSELPVPVALLASVPMPAGFVPNATAASQSSSLIAVISYSSPQVQIIDASNIPSDLANNTVINTFTAPVSGTVTFNGVPCTICAAVVNPVNNQLLLSTAQGYYSMDFTTGVFTPLTFKPAALPSPNFSLNPIAKNPYLLSANPTAGEIQILSLDPTNMSATDANPGLTAPGTAALDLLTDYAAVVDDTNSFSLVTLANPQSPLFSVASPTIGLCSPQPLPPPMNMVALGTSATVLASNASHTLFTSQTSGNSVGVQIWPQTASGQLGTPSFQLQYGYGLMPNTPPTPTAPGGNPFVNGNDPNSIATFTSVVDKNNYGVLADGNQQWVAKINFKTLLTNANILAGNGSPSLPCAEQIDPSILVAGVGGDPVIFLPTPSSAVTVSQASINFGNQAMGTSSVSSLVTVTNIGSDTVTISQIAIQGTNAGDFTETNTCTTPLLPQSNCAINVTFTPTAAGSASATLSVTDNGGSSPQVIALSGTGTT